MATVMKYRFGYFPPVTHPSMCQLIMLKQFTLKIAED
jgi:hypothetical protein